MVTFGIGFVIVIIRSHTANGKQCRKTFVLLDCEKGDKYRKDKHEMNVGVTSTRKCDCPFKLWRKLISNGQGWMLKIIWARHNHVH